jgi:hypothetical protein
MTLQISKNQTLSLKERKQLTIGLLFCFPMDIGFVLDGLPRISSLITALPVMICPDCQFYRLAKLQRNPPY